MIRKLLGAVLGKGPAEFNCRLEADGIDFPVQPGRSLLQAALDRGIAFPHNCRAGGCAECKCQLVAGKVKELTDKSYKLSGEELRSNFILACQSLPRSDLVVKVALRAGPSHPVVESAGVVERHALLTHDIMHLVVRLDSALAFTPGQYADVSLLDERGDPLATRSYSFANCPDSGGVSDVVEFFIRAVPGGQFSGALFRDANVGMRVRVQGPYGSFHLRNATAPLLFAAGGSGLAPIVAMMRGETQDIGSGTRDLTVVVGARTTGDLYLLEEMEQFGKHWRGRFEFVPVLSAEPDPSDWKGLRGMVADRLPEILGARLAEHHAYLCGPPAMIDTCIDVLRKGGIRENVIYFDKFTDSGSGAGRPG